jgi:hypothetical protein
MADVKSFLNRIKHRFGIKFKIDSCRRSQECYSYFSHSKKII